MAMINIRKALLSTALILAAPAVMAVGYSYSDIDGQVLKLDGNVAITNDNDTKINLSLRDSDVKQVLRMFADKAGLNIVFHSSVNGSVTLDLVDVSLNDAFKLVLQITGMTYYLDDNTMIVISKNDKSNESLASREMTILPVKYVDAAKIAQFLNKNIFSKKRPGLSTTEIATVNTSTNELILFGMQSDIDVAKKIIDQFDKKPMSATFTVNHTTPAEMATMICNILTPGGAELSGDQTVIEDGGATGFAAGGGNGSVVLGENVVACTLASEIEVGSTIPFNAHSLKISYFPQRGTVQVFGGSQSQIDLIGEFIKENDVKQPQALIELAILELSEIGDKDFTNNWSVSGGDITFNFDNSTGTKVAHATRQGFTKIAWEMNYLLKTGKARVLANPKVIVTNGQESVIDLTSDYLESVDVEFLQTSGAGASAVAQKSYNISNDNGLKVTMTPFISPEGYVTMNIVPEYATEAGEITDIEYDQQTGEKMPYLAATLLSRRNLDIKNARIKDGETLIIAGLIQEQTEKEIVKIPILGDLPGIGAAFRSVTSNKTKKELVIMVTPKIILDNEDVGINNL